MFLQLLILFTCLNLLNGEPPQFCDRASCTKELEIGKGKIQCDPKTSVHKGSFSVLCCCYDDYHNITWYRPDGLVPKTNSNYMEKEKEQELHMKSPDGHLDQGLWSCEIYAKNGSMIKRTIDLVVRDCNKASVALVDETAEEILQLPSKNIAMPCKVKLGCVFKNEEGDACPNFNKILQWFKIGLHNKTRIQPCNENSVPTSRLCVNTTLFGNGIGLIANLTIINIHKEDYGQYVCQYSADTNINMTKTLKEGDPDSPVIRYEDDMKAKISAATVIPISVIILIIISIMYCKRIELKLKYKDTWARRCTSTNNKEYDAFLLYSEKAESKGRQFALGQLREILEDKYHYKLFISERDSMAGEDKAEPYQKIEKCHTLLMVISPEFIEDEWCLFAFQSHVQENNIKKVYIILEEVQNSLWDDPDYEHAHSLRSDMSAGNKIIWPQHGVTDSPNQDTCSYLCMPCKKRLNNGRLDKFWKQLRLYMPPLPKSTKTGKTNPSCSSHAPLLPSCQNSSVPTKNNVQNSSPLCSDNTEKIDVKVDDCCPDKNIYHKNDTLEISNNKIDTDLRDCDNCSANTKQPMFSNPQSQFTLSDDVFVRETSVDSGMGHSSTSTTPSPANLSSGIEKSNFFPNKMDTVYE